MHLKQIWTQVLQDRFGNYIVQRVIETCSGAEKEEAWVRDCSIQSEENYHQFLQMPHPPTRSMLEPFLPSQKKGKAAQNQVKRLLALALPKLQSLCRCKSGGGRGIFFLHWFRGARSIPNHIICPCKRVPFWIFLGISMENPRGRTPATNSGVLLPESISFRQLPRSLA